ncbi:isoleucine--tRNA ligase, partial [Clostridioides difficile]
CRAIAPFAPYMSEEMYRNLTGEVSVHLAEYPKCNEELVDTKLEEKMDLAKNLVTLGRASREVERIKVRQPLQKVLVDGKFEDTISDVVDLIKEELNVKEVIFAKDLDEYMNFSLKPNFKEAGPLLGAKMNLFVGALSKLNAHETANKLEKGETLTVDLDGEAFEFNKDLVLIGITAKEGFNVSVENNLFVILDTKLTEELINEGYAREFISKVQQLRKSNNFEVLDNIVIEYCGDDEIAKAVDHFNEYIKSETLALEINRVDDKSLEEQNLNDHMTGIKVIKK